MYPANPKALCSLCVSLLFLSLPSYAALPFFGKNDSAKPTLAPMIQEVSPAVVNISVQAKSKVINNPLLNDPFFRHFFNLPQQQSPQSRQRTQAAGSGVIVDADEGIIVTNHHVVEDAEEIIVQFSDGDSVKATLVGSDPEVDIAVLRVEDKEATKARGEIPIANSDDILVGDFVVAVGNPFGLGQTVTTGVVSALGRSGLGIEGYENFIQTDASINPGNSGGALVDLNGHLVGINTAILAPSGGNVGIGFAIPANMMESSLSQILEHGEVKRGKIGVLIQDLTPELAQAFDLERSQRGVLVAQVMKGSAAENAGLTAGDIITGVNGKATETASMLRNAIGLRSIGDTVKVSYLRDGQVKNTQITIAGDEETEAAQTKKTSDALDERLEGLQLGEIDNKLVIQGIEQGSAAYYTGLQVGDVIVSVNRHDVSKLADMKKALQQKGNLLLRVIRDEMPLYIVIQ
ncbi:MAG TPA: serine endoprotease DegQ [Gammaproteobacteria bacterium]|nr:serine endoprotease DegQ [Gammaproteobacteria bacterium]HBF07146.1 serine endoprotease DegQ [Gammaproteobacteria bacterium]HCK93789.1 serine endoprotease DegQ [Gammaproteobacteria bacterium]